MEKNNTDTHQVQDGGAIGYSKEYLSGLATAFNEGYKRFCLKERNIFGEKVDRKHLLNGWQKIDCTNHDKKS
jgi:hypothetical protein|tara:strand:- start:759 stop:974 length:216 start_codon:yes stop_codon:yes gene_type:complete